MPSKFFGVRAILQITIPPQQTKAVAIVVDLADVTSKAMQFPRFAISTLFPRTKADDIVLRQPSTISTDHSTKIDRHTPRRYNQRARGLTGGCIRRSARNVLQSCMTRICSRHLQRKIAAYLVTACRCLINNSSSCAHFREGAASPKVEGASGGWWCPMSTR